MVVRELGDDHGGIGTPYAAEAVGCNLQARWLATGQQVVDLMFSLRDANQTTLVLVTHDELLASRCDVQYRLDAGILSAPQL